MRKLLLRIVDWLCPEKPVGSKPLLTLEQEETAKHSAAMQAVINLEMRLRKQARRQARTHSVWTGYLDDARPFK
jgi:hypothetical protein